MDCFKILEIQPTKDLKLIKKAYSKLLPKYSPEIDPIAFQKLREAYEKALQYAEKENNSTEEVLSPVDEFMNDFKTIYNDFEKRIDITNWENLLDKDLCYNLNTSKEISYKILNFIMHEYNFPKDVWKLFDSHFSWNLKKEKLYLDFPKNFIDFVLYKVNETEELRYDLLLNCENNQQDKFILEYEKACNFLNDNNIYYAKKLLKKQKKFVVIIQTY